MRTILLLSLLSVPAFSKGLEELPTLKEIIHTGLLQTLVAKEFCSCAYVTGLPEKECAARSNLDPAALKTISIKFDSKKRSVRVSPNILGVLLNGPISGPTAEAQMDPGGDRYGCRITKGP